MKLGSALAALALVIVTGPPDAVAFSPSLSSTGTSKYQYWTTTTTTSSPSSSSTNLMMARNNQPSKDDDNNNNNVNNPLVNFCATAAMTAMLWGSPTIMAQQAYSHSTSTTTSTTTTAVQQMLYDTSAANAKEMASGTGSRVNKDAESLLRLGLPFKNKEVRNLQETLETIKYDIGSKRKSAAIDGAKKSKTMLAGKQADKIAAACQSPKVCTEYMKEMADGLDPLVEAMTSSQDAFTGSDQERDALDKAYKAQEKVVDLLTKLEEQMVPPGYETPVPPEYSDLPQLKRRAKVEMIVKKGESGAQFDINGVNFPQAKLVMVIDGYASPVTGGNFVDLVQKGFYDNMKIQRSDGFVVQTGDPDGEAFGYTGGKPSKSIGAGPHGERLIPTEIFVRGDKGPFYETTIEDEGRGGEATILPFSAYGAMGWARDEYDPNTGSSQFFWLLFDSDLTPAGKNVLDGRYPCFGYVVQGSDFLQDIKEGDVIVSAKVTEGLEYLKQPSS